MDFQLTSQYEPTGDQPQAIDQLTQGVLEGLPAQVLLGVTGSGKTFTMANVIKNVGKPTLIFSHNKTLAHQLYTEMKQFFPNNAVEYYVSYYDYYQPEAYIPSTGTYIEKDLAINENLDRLRLAATSALLSGRKDVIVVTSVSCIYGMGSPMSFDQNVINVYVGQDITLNALKRKLVDALYINDDMNLERGKFSVKGETIDIYLAYDEKIVRINYDFDEICSIREIDVETGEMICPYEEYKIFPANLFMTSKEQTEIAIDMISEDLDKQVEYFESIHDTEKANLIKTRVNNDLDMIRELGHCSGIENYSRYFDGRQPGERPYCLLDFFPEDYLLIVDESHQSIPQVKAMYGGDRRRKENLVEYGYRLPAALDNRPLQLSEFEELTPQTIFVSATPADYELERAEGVIVEQLIRPTGLLDPPIEIHPARNQVDDLLEEIDKVVGKHERVLVTTLTKRMAEELSRYLTNVGVRNKYIHSDVETLERVEIMQELREGVFDVLIGVNLLREGLDLPEVSLVAILDADKEGFLRSDRALIQTIGRAARNISSKAILYADKITDSMKRAIAENTRNREKQQAYNTAHGIVPRQVYRAIGGPITQDNSTERRNKSTTFENTPNSAAKHKTTTKDIDKQIRQLEKLMQQAAAELNFMDAAMYRDQIKKLKEEKKSIK